MAEVMKETKDKKETRDKKYKRATKNKKSRFFKIYFAFIILFFIAMAVVMVKLYDWLLAYEKAQPVGKCEEVYKELFENPDWGNLYEMAEKEDTLFEGKDAYASYMQKKVGADKLEVVKTSAGLSGDKKYFVKHGEERIAGFTLVSEKDAEGKVLSWELGEIELLAVPVESVQIKVQEGRKVYVNDVALSEDYMIERSWTVAEDYLPEGVVGERFVTYRVEDLLVTPAVRVENTEGSEIAMEVHDKESADGSSEAAGSTEHFLQQEGVSYTEVMTYTEISEEQWQVVETAAKEYSKHMIGVPVKLSNYFDTDSAIYKAIRGNENWMQDYRSYDFTEGVCTRYYRYNEDLFLAGISVTLEVTRPGGSIKEYPIESDFILQKKEDGKWLVINMANVDMMQEKKEVRMTYYGSEGVLESDFVASDSKQLSTPKVEVPTGQKFAGWAKEEADESGNKTRTLLFVPDENGVVNLPENYELEPMKLYPLFETE